MIRRRSVHAALVAARSLASAPEEYPPTQADIGRDGKVTTQSTTHGPTPCPPGGAVSILAAAAEIVVLSRRKVKSGKPENLPIGYAEESAAGQTGASVFLRAPTLAQVLSFVLPKPKLVRAHHERWN